MTKSGVFGHFYILEKNVFPYTDEFDIDLLDISDGFRGSGKNDLLGARFSTHDRDNDNSNGNCAADSNSGWWFNGKWSF